MTTLTRQRRCTAHVRFRRPAPEDDALSVAPDPTADTIFASLYSLARRGDAYRAIQATTRPPRIVHRLKCSHAHIRAWRSTTTNENRPFVSFVSRRAAPSGQAFVPFVGIRFSKELASSDPV